MIAREPASSTKKSAVFFSCPEFLLTCCSMFPSIVWQRSDIVNGLSSKPGFRGNQVILDSPDIFPVGQASNPYFNLFNNLSASAEPKSIPGLGISIL